MRQIFKRIISKEAHNLGRRFLGIDINPFSIEHTLFLLSLPNAYDYKKAINLIKKNVVSKISESYALENGDTATHFLWNKDYLQEVWTKNCSSRKKIQLKPTDFDLSKIKKFEDYSVRNIQKGTFFENARINSMENMTVYDLFTKRALYNIDLILDEINKFSGDLKRALQLTLTSSSGQMSNMVFAITSRGKTKNQQSEKIEVGSWVIGLWRPDLHFEINVWNCFENKANKLYKALLMQDTPPQGEFYLCVLFRPPDHDLPIRISSRIRFPCATEPPPRRRYLPLLYLRPFLPCFLPFFSRLNIPVTRTVFP